MKNTISMQTLKNKGKISMPSSVHDRTGANMDRTESKSDTPLTRPDSRPVPAFIVFSPTSNPFGPFASAKEAAEFADKHWPDKDCDVQRLWTPEEAVMIPEYAP